MKFGRYVGAVLATVAIGLLMTGCLADRLEPGGAYCPAHTNELGALVIDGEPDYTLAAADAVFESSYKMVVKLCGIERENRRALWTISPQIKRAMDQVRTETLEVRLKWATARQAYLASPTPSSKDALNRVLEELQRLVNAANAALQTSPSGPPVGI